MYRNKITALVLVILAAASASLGAWEFSQDFGTNFAYYTDDDHGGAPGSGPSWFLLPDYTPSYAEDSQAWLDGPYGTGGSNWTSDDPETRNLGSGWGSVELESFYRFRATTPFLVGSGALTEGNNIRFQLKPVIAPVSLHLETEILWTPIAFLQFGAGYDFGTGWALSILGIDGLALNDSDDITNTTRSGLAGKLHFSGTFQFDLAALVPGEMNHIVVSATATMRYIHYTGAEKGQAWYWRADGGQNFNGWQYYGEYALGWQPPWKVNFLGLLAEHTFWVSSYIRELAPMDNPYVYNDDITLASENWGSDFHYWRFGPVMNIALNDRNSLTILMQFNNGLYYTEETAYARWFRRWEYAGSKYIKFNRLALAYTLNL